MVETRKADFGYDGAVIKISHKKTGFIIPWWLKIGSKLILSRLPFNYKTWQSLGIFRHGNMDRSDYSISVFSKHIENASVRSHISGKTILELGPGDGISTAIIAAAHGAAAILVDVGDFVRTDLTPYLELSSRLKLMGYETVDLRGAETVQDVLKLCGAKYMPKGIDSLKTIKNDSVDIIFSHAVLEHIKRTQFFETLMQCRRILKKGGVCSHQVDLRDHLGGGLNNLRFSDAVWESPFFSNSGFYTNRIQFDKMLEVFNATGFEVDVKEIRHWEMLPIKREKINKRFSNVPDDILKVSGFMVRLS